MTVKRIYAYPKVGSFGLCHSLLAWARAVAWADQNGAKLIAPSWCSIRGRIGPVIRRERDKRRYHELFQFPRYITGFNKLYLLNTSKLVPIDSSTNTENFKTAPNVIFVFENLISENEETYFHEIIDKRELIKNELLSITKPIYLPSFKSENFIAVHIRCGDFQSQNVENATGDVLKNSRTPISWFAEMLTDIRSFLKCDIPAIVYSDGSSTEIGGILSLPNVKRSQYRASVTDLLDIGSSRLLLSSGSGFSMWGAYLGATSRICFPRQKLCSVLEPNSENFELEAPNFASISEEHKKCIYKMFLDK